MRSLAAVCCLHTRGRVEVDVTRRLDNPAVDVLLPRMLEVWIPGAGKVGHSVFRVPERILQLRGRITGERLPSHSMAMVAQG